MRKKQNQQLSRDLPAMLGGAPAFTERVPITRPTISGVENLQKGYRAILESGMITNAAYVRELEKKTARYLDVKHAVAVSSCTSGLMLLMKALGLKGEVILPSFTFHATAHAVVWNGLTPIFVDCDPETFNIDLKETQRAITPRTSAILAVHIFGNPCPVKELESIAQDKDVHLLFDSAHGFGTKYQGKTLGSFGKAEVFSLSPTKLLTAAEGGIVTTNDDALAQQIRTGRNYGDPGTYDCEFSGLNARMSELHALLGIESLKALERNVKQRNEIAQVYQQSLGDVAGISFQKINQGDRSSFKDFSILVDGQKFGLTRDELQQCLLAENIVTKEYFDPPVHLQKAFRQFRQKKDDKELESTLFVSHHALSLPLFSHMPIALVEDICARIKRIHGFREEIKSKCFDLKGHLYERESHYCPT